MSPFLDTMLAVLRARGLEPIVIGKDHPRIRWVEDRRTITVHVPRAFLDPNAALNAADLVGPFLQRKRRA